MNGTSRMSRGVTHTYSQSPRRSGSTVGGTRSRQSPQRGVVLHAWWRKGCPEGLSVRAWLMALPAWLLTWLALALTTPGAAIVAWVLMGLSGFIVAGMVLLVAAPIVHALGDRMRAWVTVLVWALAGAAGIVASLALGLLAGLAPGATGLGPVAAAVVFAVAWFPVGGRFACAVRTDARTREALLRQLARERALALESARLVDADRRRLVQQTEAVVSDQLRKATALTADPEAAAGALQAVVDEVVRPLSRELERGEVHESALVEAVHSIGAVSPRPLSDFASQLRRPSTPVVLTTLFRIALAFVAVMAVTNWQWPTTGAVLALLLLAVYAVISSGLLVLAIARADASARELSLAVDGAEWAASRLRQLAWSERERLGRVIHGEAQARIVATALQIQLGESNDVEDRVASLETDIHRALVAEEDEADWRRVWHRVLRVWEYSVDVHQQLDPVAEQRLDDDAVAAHAVVSVMREGVTNAVRHGGARRLDLELSLADDDVLRLVIADDGTGGRPDGPPGMGSRTMDAACLEWNLSTHSIGHTLIARIPTSRGAVHV